MKLPPYTPLSPLPALTAGTSAVRDKRAQAEQQKLETQKQALTALKHHNEAQKDDAKALARKRVEQLKARLQMLEQMSGLDPAQKARLIAQLSKELKSAAGAYSAAGGASSDLGGAASATAAPSDVAAEPEKASAPEASGDQPSDQSGDQSGTQSGTGRTPYDTNANRQTDERQSLQAREDAEFAREVRALMRKIKSQLDRAKAEATRDTPETDFKEAEASLRRINDHLNSMDSIAATLSLTSGMVLSISV